MKDFLLFRRMLTPSIIQVLFWIGVILCIWAGIHNMLNHAIPHGLQILLIGPILLRILCEFLLVVFRINKSLTEIAVQEKR